MSLTFANFGSCFSLKQLLSFGFFSLLSNKTFAGIDYNSEGYEEKLGLPNNTLTKQPGAFVVASLISFGSFMFTFLLLCGQTYYILGNVTSWEANYYDQISYLKPYPKGFLPFYKNVKANVILTCFHGGRLRHWEVPHPSDPKIAKFFNICENKYWSC